MSITYNAIQTPSFDSPSLPIRCYFPWAYCKLMCLTFWLWNWILLWKKIEELLVGTIQKSGTIRITSRMYLERVNSSSQLIPTTVDNRFTPYKLNDEHIWSVLLSSLKNCTMTITNAFNCISDSLFSWTILYKPVTALPQSCGGTVQDLHANHLQRQRSFSPSPWLPNPWTSQVVWWLDSYTRASLMLEVAITVAVKATWVSILSMICSLPNAF